MIGRILPRFVLGSVAAFALQGCINLNFVRTRVGEPIPDTAVERLAPAQDDLTSCLEQLGAPLFVWSSEDGFVRVAYAWVHVFDWGISASWSLDQFVSVGGAFDSVDFKAHGVVLAFDTNLRLDHVSRGYLSDLAPSSGGTPTSRMLNSAPR